MWKHSWVNYTELLEQCSRPGGVMRGANGFKMGHTLAQDLAWASDPVPAEMLYVTVLMTWLVRMIGLLAC